MGRVKSNTRIYSILLILQNIRLYPKVGDKIGNLHLIEISHGALTEVKCFKNLHQSKILDIDVSKGGIVTCSSDKTVKILQPDLSMNTIVHLAEETYGEVTAVSHLKGILAMGHSEEVIRFYDRSDYGCK